MSDTDHEENAPEDERETLTFEQHKARIEAHGKLIAEQLTEAFDLPDGMRFEFGPV